MSLDVTLARIAEIHSLLAPRQPAAPQQAGAPTRFAGTLLDARTGLGAQAAAPLAATQAPAPGTSAGQAIVALIQKEVGQAEQPPGSNDSPRIAQYRQATAGSGVGPWCAYFTSWAAREAGVPLGDQGQGYGRVDDVWAWAERSGKSIPAAGATPQPGDLIVWDEHIGVVETVLPDGRVQTIEGNSSDAVTRRVHDASGDGAIGYVRLG
ncbi:MAG: CHAP domain-containing protein [Solirubrobacteraceae bacterium]